MACSSTPGPLGSRSLSERVSYALLKLQMSNVSQIGAAIVQKTIYSITETMCLYGCQQIMTYSATSNVLYSRLQYSALPVADYATLSTCG
jgi:hypothetical protein